ncbi:helix-turn-helix domain-containing protein [Synergistaceae bacterium OttesenSCG-928-D05]|nr:helix-turn-helix domain-containing protein [Synergistaceae bacterium OttesenSCG-928-D05]
MREYQWEQRGTEWIDAALSLQNFGELLSRIAHDSTSSLCFRESSGAIFTASSDPEFIENVEAYPLQELFRHYEVDRIVDNDVPLGHLITEKTPPLSANSPLRKAAILAVKIHAIRRKSNAEYRISIESDILQRLLLRNTKLRKILEEFDGKIFPLDKNSLVAVIGFKKRNSERARLEDRALSNMEEKFSRFFRRYMSWQEKQRLVIAVTPQFPMDETAVCDFIVQTIENLKELHGENEPYTDVCMGIGSCKEELQALPESYEEANRAFHVAVLEAGAWWRRWGDLGSYRLLTIFAEHSESDLFIENTLGELARKNLPTEHLVLLDTIRELDRHAWNLKQTSVFMNLHYNTLKYRYHRIEEVLDVNLNDAHTRFNLSFAVKLLAMKGR